MNEQTTVPAGLSDETLMFLAVASIDALFNAFVEQGMDASTANITPSFNGTRTGPVKVADIANALRDRLGIRINAH